jgi:hypothetical protein
MPEPNFPDSPLVSLSFDLRERTPADPPADHAQVAQCNFQHADGQLTSFDPEQLPKFLAALLGELVITQATTLTNQVTIIAGHAAELAAKDANAQELLEKLDATAAKLAKAEAALTVPVELIQAAGLLPLAAPESPSSSDQPDTGSAAASGSTPAPDDQGGDPASTGDTPVPQVAPPTDEELFNVAAAPSPPPPPEAPPATVPKARSSRRRSSPAE